MGEEMLKVLIADDEKNICLMIQKLIPWERYGMEVIGLVHTGMDVVRVMGEMRPDIVISDIRMPGYDGLELVQKAHDMDIIADFIIISGYKYFEYAHKALNLGVEHYLLKPIDKKELEEKTRQELEGIPDEENNSDEDTIALNGAVSEVYFTFEERTKDKTIICQEYGYPLRGNFTKTWEKIREIQTKNG